MNKNYFDISNKIAIVTGSSRGIGYAIAKGFIESGALVHGISRTEPDLTKDKNYTHHIIDLSNKKSIIEVVNEIGIYRKKIDILINCAGLSLDLQSEKMHDKSLNNILDINLLSPYFMSASVIRFMKKNGGSIINITSIGANLGFPGNPAYISSKAGLSGLTRSLSYDYAHLGIRVNNLVPGYFKTDMTKKSFYDPLKNKERANRSLLRRWGDPKELIGPAIFLASKASSFITGTDIIVDGGWSIKGL